MAFNDLSTYRQFAETLKNAEPLPRTMAIGDAGVIPYITQWRVIDLNGHNDPLLAHHPELEVEIVLKQNPDLVIPGVDIGNYNQERLREELIRRGYVLVGNMRTGDHPPVSLYARSDYARSAAVTAIKKFTTPAN
jgi:hypothetical protein